MSEILQIEHLSKHFGGLKAVNDFSITVEKGEIHALIGPNGARQNDAVQSGLRLSDAERRHHHLRRQKRHQRQALSPVQQGAGPHVSDCPAVPRHDDARQRHGRRLYPHRPCESGAGEGNARAANCQARPEGGGPGEKPEPLRTEAAGGSAGACPRNRSSSCSTRSWQDSTRRRLRRSWISFWRFANSALRL